MSNLEQVQKSLKERGFWQVRFLPTEQNPELISPIGRCIELVQSASVSSRGWDYPHIPRRNDDEEVPFMVMGDYIESWIDWGMHKEICRLYQSGQFLHLFPVYEDWYAEDPNTSTYPQYKNIAPGKIIDPLQIIYRFTEIYLFLQNLVNQDVYSSPIDVEISLHNTYQRSLAFINTARHLSGNYQSHQKVIKLPIKRVTPEQVRLDVLPLALEAIVNVLHQFQWLGVSPSLIEEEQKKLIERRI